MATAIPPETFQWDLTDADLGFGRELSSLLLRLEKFRTDLIINPPSFFQLPDQEIKPIVNAARSLNRYKNLVVIGVGGSSLGAETLVSLHGDNNREVIFLNNLDPFECRKLLQHGNPEQTGYVVVSKSGTTPEVLAQFSVFVQHTKAQLGVSWREHWVVITNPESGPLREFALKESITNLIFPSNLPGRFSALSQSGLFPAVWAGVNIERVLKGGEAIRDAWIDGDKSNQTLLKVAALYFLHHVRMGKTISVMMPYGSRFRKFGEWYSQLWAESLGKSSGENTYSGSTPLVAVGTTDQHSLLQLFVEGRDDKIYTVLTLDDFGEPQAIPTVLPCKEAEFLNNCSLEELTRVEAESTIRTLRLRGRPVINIKCPSLDEYFTGELLMSYELITIAAASLYGVNPYDQPGVEESKRLTLRLLSESVL